MKSTINISYRLYLAALVFAPLAFGTTEEWSYAVLEILAIGALLIYIKDIRQKPGKFVQIPGILPLALLLCLILLQLLPLPPFIVKILSPTAYALRSESVGVFTEMPWAPLSLYPKATVFQFFRLAAYVCIYILTIQYTIEGRYLKKTVNSLIITASIISILALLQYFSQAPYLAWEEQKIFWVRDLTQGGSPFGPFVNRNHFAGWMAMVLPLAIGVFLYRKPRAIYSGFREWLVAVFTHRHAGQRILIGFAALMMAVSIFVSLSRGGIIAASIGMLVFIVLFAIRMRSQRVRLIAIFSIVLVALSVGWFGWQPIFDRFEDIRSADGQIQNARFKIWQDTGRMIAKYPLLGTGFGTYRYVYPAFQTAEFTKGVQPRYAHNDYLQFVTEGGIVGSVLGVWAISAILISAIRRIPKRRDPWAICLGISALGGLSAIFIHCLVDFHFYIGANGLYIFLLCGIAVGGTHLRLNNFLKPTYLPVASRLYRRGLKTAAVLIAAVFLGFYFQTFYAGYQFETVLNADSINFSDKMRLSDLRYSAQSAKHIDPWQTHYAGALGQIEMLLDEPQKALMAYGDVLRYDPNDDEVLQRAGFTMDALGDQEAAERLIRAGIHRSPRKAVRYYHLGAWLLRNDRRPEALGALKQTVIFDPALIDQVIVLLFQNHGTVDDVFGIMPETARPHVYVAKFYHTIGETEAADRMYTEAFRAAQQQALVSWSDFAPVYYYYRKSDRLEEALYVAQKATERMPDDASVRWVLGSTYEKMGIPFRAIEEYRNVLLLDPNHEQAQRKIARLSEGR